MGAYEDAINAVADFPRLYILTAPTMKYTYRVSEIPEKLTRDKLPCAVCWGGLLEAGNLESTTFGNAGLEQDIEVEQHFYFDVETASIRKVAPLMNSFWDNYCVAIKANPFYGPATAPPVHGSLSIQPLLQFVPFGDSKYHTLILKHKLKVFL